MTTVEKACLSQICIGIASLVSIQVHPMKQDYKYLQTLCEGLVKAARCLTEEAEKERK